MLNHLEHFNLVDRAGRPTNAQPLRAHCNLVDRAGRPTDALCIATPCKVQQWSHVTVNSCVDDLYR